MSTLKDVAEKCGITVTTVSRMLNGRGYVSEKTKKKIRQAMKELNYRPNEFARAFSLKKSSFIGLIVPSASNLYFCKVIDLIEHYVSHHGYKLLLCTSNLEVKKEIEYFDMLSANKVAGVIIASHTQDIDKNISIDAPIISIDRVISQLIPSICSDNYQGGVLAAEHLIAKGCKKLAHISGSTFLNMDANKRYYGFKEVCEKRGIPHVVTDAGEEQFLSMRYESVINALLNEHTGIDGIFTSNDIIAAQVITICSKRGIKIPEQMKIVGYDDIDLCTIYNPSITTIRQSLNDICEYAVESIIHKAENKAIPSRVTFPVTLIERETT
ncbi:LacI family transcriptional regulator [Anaerobacterium chartisolvens]|uniref:LacI family transcriptional regulator n=1 Tax=Anaerobacterium chartisolvens TaxID=1297424 RepID=A0A369BMV1_9FIRM|nr:LacI family DNA-binding transcriptional regulator [Anaerobacterium chartisolvens]RCX21004.1 LacI family transcriptional regulator [Anaerobacterium chartisolvens]